MLFEPPPLRMARLRFEMRPKGTLRLPLEERGNALRGALGTNLRRAVCEPSCNDTKSCPRRDECPLARLFEPRCEAAARFGAQDAPRPFLFRPPLDPDPDFSANRPLIFELRLFGSAIADAVHFVVPLLELAKTGLAGRLLEPVGVSSLDWMGRATQSEPVALDFGWCLDVPPAGPRARIELLTPTRINGRDADSGPPSLAALVRRLRDRISFLSLAWEGRPWIADYGAIATLADRASITSYDGLQVTYLRRSTKTGKTQHLSGFRGTVTYDGVDAALWPLLRIGEEIHAGRFTEWGLGMYRIAP